MSKCGRCSEPSTTPAGESQEDSHWSIDKPARHEVARGYGSAMSLLLLVLFVPLEYTPPRSRGTDAETATGVGVMVVVVLVVAMLALWVWWRWMLFRSARRSADET